MRLLPSDPDVETIVSRIKHRDIDLQPEFQRGEVWSKTKKQRLIDSILRNWHVPPIHVIENAKTAKQEVLDGQQRLASIRDFVDNQFPVDGETQPLDPNIESLNGLYYRDLSDDWRRLFNQFTIRIYRIVDYRPGEPAEIFFRLNQPASLTAAEQRNAFFGPVRDQIKKTVELLDPTGIGKSFLGFSNSRMAYDDILARTALAVERRSIAEKITSQDLTDLYRSVEPLNFETIDLIRDALLRLAEASQQSLKWPKFNKATAFSWLIFLVRMRLRGLAHRSAGNLPQFFEFFEETRRTAFHRSGSEQRLITNSATTSRLVLTYENRAASRVADVSSVILRDAVLWLLYEDFCLQHGRGTELGTGLAPLHASFQAANIPDDESAARKLIENGWGQLP